MWRNAVSDGIWGCACPGWRHYRKCKHTSDILRRLAAVSIEAAAPAVRSMLLSARTAYLDLEGPRTVHHRTTTTRQIDL